MGSHRRSQLRPAVPAGGCEPWRACLLRRAGDRLVVSAVAAAQAFGDVILFMH